MLYFEELNTHAHVVIFPSKKGWQNEDMFGYIDMSQV